MGLQQRAGQLAAWHGQRWGQRGRRAVRRAPPMQQQGLQRQGGSLLLARHPRALAAKLIEAHLLAWPPPPPWLLPLPQREAGAGLLLLLLGAVLWLLHRAAQPAAGRSRCGAWQAVGVAQQRPKTCRWGGRQGLHRQTAL